MTNWQRIKTVFEGLVMLAFVALMLAEPELGYQVITVIIAISLILRGIRTLSYYFSMARHMVGGKNILFRGIVLLDLGLFTGSLTNIPKIYVIAYLLAVHAFSGAVDVMRALESRRLEARSWKREILTGVFNLALALACVIYLRNERVLVMIYCIGLLYSALTRIASAFRKTAIVYIQ